MTERNHVSVVAPRCVYILLASREEFDKLDLPATDHGISEVHGGHVLSKSIDAGVYVIFQHWLASPRSSSPAKGRNQGQASCVSS